MAINFVRQPSETPNVRNIDDIVPFRYAYGDQNGYVKDKGNELSYTVNGSNFRINSGRVVLFGVESDIDANGVTITVDNVATTRYYSVYYKVNLALNTTSIESEYSTEDYPTISTGDDLTANTSGTANLELYRFEATNGVISDVIKIVTEIGYVNENKINSVIDNKFNNSNTTSFGDYVVPKIKIIAENLGGDSDEIQILTYLQNAQVDFSSNFKLIVEGNIYSSIVNNNYKFSTISYFNGKENSLNQHFISSYVLQNSSIGIIKLGVNYYVNSALQPMRATINANETYMGTQGITHNHIVTVDRIYLVY